MSGRIWGWRAQYLIIALLGGAAVYVNLFLTLPREVAAQIRRHEARRLEAVAGLLAAYLEARAAVGEGPDSALGRVRPWLRDYALYAFPPEYTPDIPEVQVLAVRLPDGRYLALGLGPTGCPACGEPAFWLRLLGLSLLIWMVLLAVYVFLWARFAWWLRRIREAADAIVAGVERPPLPPASADELGQIAAAMGEIAAAMGRFREAHRRFMLTAAHELLTPLSALIDALQDAREGSPPAVRGRLDGALEQGRHLLRLVEDMLWAAREDRLAFPLRLEALDLADALIAIVEAYRAHFEANGRSLALHLLDAPLTVRADPARIRQVLGNLLENALRHSQPGETVQVLAGRGEGILVEIRGGRFGAGRSGMGIGIAIVEELTRSHGGRLEFLEGPEGILHVRLILPPASEGG